MWPMIALAAMQAIKGNSDARKAKAQQGIADSKIDLSDEGMSIPQPATAAPSAWGNAAMNIGAQVAGNALSGPAGNKPDTAVPQSSFGPAEPAPSGFQKAGLLTKTPTRFKKLGE